jgi:protein TonB
MMSTPNPADTIPPATEPTVPPPRRSAALWLLLALLAIVLIGWYWLGKREAPTPVAPLPVPAAIEPAPVERAPDRATAPAARKAAPATPAGARTSPAMPLPAYRVTPEYPVAALRVGERGTVVLRVNVGIDGMPGEIDFARRSGSRELDNAARDAVTKWRFEPARSNGKPVASVVEIPIDFEPPR